MTQFDINLPGIQGVLEIDILPFMILALLFYLLIIQGVPSSPFMFRCGLLPPHGTLFQQYYY